MNVIDSYVIGQFHNSTNMFPLKLTLTRSFKYLTLQKLFKNEINVIYHDFAVVAFAALTPNVNNLAIIK